MALQPRQVETFLGSFIKFQPRSAANNATFTELNCSCDPDLTCWSKLASKASTSGRALHQSLGKAATQALQHSRLLLCILVKQHEEFLNCKAAKHSFADLMTACQEPTSTRLLPSRMKVKATTVQYQYQW